MTIKNGAKAEWHTLTHVLLHEPGEEFRIAGMNPKDNLFDMEIISKYGSFNYNKALAQHKGLQEAYVKSGVNVLLLGDILAEQTLSQLPPNLVYTRDQQITTGNGIVMGNMRKEDRRPEIGVMKEAFGNMGVPILYETQTPFLEGGDYMPAGNVAIFGCGKRTRIPAIIELMKEGVLGFDEVIAVDNPYCNDSMHLDTWFNIVDKDLAITRGTVYNSGRKATSFRMQGNGKIIADQFTFKQHIKDLGFDVLEIPDLGTPYEKYATNLITISPRNVIPMHINDTYPGMLEDVGIKIAHDPNTGTPGIEMKEIVKAYGSIHCLTCVPHGRKVC